MASSFREGYVFLAIVVLVGAVAVVGVLQVWEPAFSTLTRNLGGQAIETGLPDNSDALIFNGETYPLEKRTAGEQLSTGHLVLNVTGSQAILEGGTANIVLVLGETVILASDAVTLMRVAGGEAGFLVANRSVACAIPHDAQTPLCRGPVACKTGTCELLPGCTGSPDGLKETWGSRDLYCCSEALSLEPCGGGT